MRPAVEHIAHRLMRKYNNNDNLRCRDRAAPGGGVDAAAVYAAARPEAVLQLQALPGGDGGQRTDGVGTGGGGGGHGGGEALVFLTYQSYFTDTAARLAADLQRAQEEGYSLGVNLVGPLSLSVARTPEPLPIGQRMGGIGLYRILKQIPYGAYLAV
jgi:hypothetical protein